MSGAETIAARFRGERGAFRLDAAFHAPLKGVTAIFGPSGSGKTTLLRCVAGLERMEGELRVGDAVWQDAGRFLAPHKRGVGYVFQGAGLFDHLNVGGNLDYAIRRARAPGPDRARVVEMLGLAPLLGRRPWKLSGGERQRAAIGRALLAAPRLLLMDEPLSALDARAKAEILPYLDGLSDATGLPILYVSHDVGEVARLADRVVQIADGKVLGMGPTAAMVERMGLEAGVSAFEASAVLTGAVAEKDARYRLTRLDVDGQRLAAPEADVAVGQTVRLRVRARDVAIATERPTAVSIRNVLACRVAEIDAPPGAAHADAILDLGRQRLRARVTLEALEDLGLRDGQEVFALIKTVSFEGGQ